ncbi:MAG: hypothetical protein Q8S01_07100 [Ignavibacteria bacterium]|nr:hypothetical protein [Ignavibacteria bacterium]
MGQSKRILIAVAVLVFLICAVLALEAWRGVLIANKQEVTIDPGDVPIYQNGELTAAFSVDDISNIQQIQFTDKEEGKVQEGWPVSSVFKQYFKTNKFSDSMQIVFTSSSRSKSISLTWGEIINTDYMVMFDLSGRGTLKLVSLLEKLDTRDEWIQDVDKIEVIEH